MHRARVRRLITETLGAPAVRGIGGGLLIYAFGIIVGADKPSTAVFAVAVALVSGLVLHAVVVLQRRIRNAEDMALLTTWFPGPVPPLGTWAIDADFARLLLEQASVEPRVIVEFGSGASTVLLAHALKGSDTEIVSFDHDAGFAAITRSKLAEAGLDGNVTVVVAELETLVLGGTSVEWYAQEIVKSALPATIDLVVVDGPPSRSRWSRWPAYEVVRGRLAGGAVVLLDDGRTRFGRATARRWAHEHHDAELYWVDTVKGTWRVVNTDNASTGLSRRFREAVTTVHPRPSAFGRWPVRR